MAISGHTARFLIAEHAYKPLPEEILLLGRQTINVYPSTLHSIFDEVGITPQPVPDELDMITREAKDRTDGIWRMTDSAFFSAFGVKRLRAVDHSDFEGADIILDLTRPILKTAEGIADFIFDGSVLDNVFSPAEAISNVARMLRPGGRYFGINMAGTRNSVAYTAFNPYWYYDFFVLNGFKDVKVYIYDFYDFPPKTGYLDSIIHAVDPNAKHEDAHSFQSSGGLVGLLIIAEKGEDSTADRWPAQGVYRSDAEWKEFYRKLEPIKNAPRPLINLRQQTQCMPIDNPLFTYVGNVDSLGLCTWDASPLSQQKEDGFVLFGGTFPGYDWELPEVWQDRAWRRIVGGRKPSVVVLNMASYRDYRIEFDIHHAATIGDIEELAVVCNGTPLATRVQLIGARTCLIAALPSAIAGSGLVELALSLPVGRSIGINSVVFNQVRRRTDSTPVEGAASDTVPADEAAREAVPADATSGAAMAKEPAPNEPTSRESTTVEPKPGEAVRDRGEPGEPR